MSEIYIKYEDLFKKADEIGNLHEDFLTTLEDNKNNGRTAYYEEMVRQLFDKSSFYGEEGTYNASLPSTLEEIVNRTSTLFNQIAQKEKDRDIAIANQISK